MKYVLINPVVDGMYDRIKLDELLKEHDFERVECETSWGPIVKDKYHALIEKSNDTIIDVRCPVAASKVRENHHKEGMFIPEIEPILLHCAREISEREELKESDKWITTPCKALADQGNQLGLRETTFIAWNEFESMLNRQLSHVALGASPIPPGFFQDFNYNTSSVSGEEEIKTYFEKEQWKEKRLVEMLYCQQGCHNGDGVSYDE